MYIINNTKNPVEFRLYHNQAQKILKPGEKVRVSNEDLGRVRYYQQIAKAFNLTIQQTSQAPKKTAGLPTPPSDDEVLTDLSQDSGEKTSATTIQQPPGRPRVFGRRVPNS